MAQRPALLRTTRLVDALALLVVAGALAGGSAHAAARQVAAPASDPSTDGSALAWSIPGGGGVLAAAGTTTPVGRFPALGVGKLAFITAGGTVTVIDRASGAAIPVPVAAGADALAVSSRWLAWRRPGPDRLQVLDLATPGAVPRTIDRVRAPGTLSRPALSGDRLAWASATTRGSQIRALELAAPGARSVTLRRERGALVTAPALYGDQLLFVRADGRHQELRLTSARPGRGGRVLLRIGALAARDGGHGHGYGKQGVRPEDRDGPIPAARYRLLGTALDGAAAYVTRQPRRGGTPSVLRVGR
jgi:hypothetical protein